MLRKSLKKRARMAARKLRAGGMSLPEQRRLIRLHAADFVAESEKIEGAEVSAKELLSET